MSVALVVVAFWAAVLLVALLLVRQPRRCPHPGCDSPPGFHVHVDAPPEDGPGVDGWARRG